MRPSAWQIVALVIILILLFGWKSLPNMARSLGQSMRIFKSEVDQMKDENQARNADKDRPAIQDRPAIEDEDTAMRDYREANERRPDEPRA